MHGQFASTDTKPGQSEMSNFIPRPAVCSCTQLASEVLPVLASGSHRRPDVRPSLVWGAAAVVVADRRLAVAHQRSCAARERARVTFVETWSNAGYALRAALHVTLCRESTTTCIRRRWQTDRKDIRSPSACCSAPNPWTGPWRRSVLLTSEL